MLKHRRLGPATSSEKPICAPKRALSDLLGSWGVNVCVHSSGVRQNGDVLHSTMINGTTLINLSVWGVLELS